MSIIKKLSVKAVVGDVKKLARDLEDGKTLMLARFVGIAHGTQTGTTDNGDWTAFKGDFGSVNLLTGEEFSAGKLFLPEVAENLTIAALSNADTVELGFDIGIKGNTNSVTGYEYIATPLIKPTENNPVTALMAKLDAPKIAQIEAPKKDAKK